MSDEPQATADEKPPVENPTGLATTARKISGRTTDLLAIAIICFGVFAVSGRLTDWWNTSPDSVLEQSQVVPDVVGSSVAWPEADIPVGFDLGDLPVRVDRLQIAGSRKEVDEIIMQHLKSNLTSSTSLIPTDFDERISEATRKIERLVGKVAPTEEKKGEWQIFRLDQPGTPGFAAMFLGMRIDSQKQSRLATWAMAMPWRQEEWKVFFFKPTRQSPSHFSLPPDGRLTMSMTEPSGTELTTFQATIDSASIHTWQTHFSTHLTQAGWNVSRDWTQSDVKSIARFEKENQAAEVILKQDGGELRGLVNVITRPSTN